MIGAMVVNAANASPTLFAMGGVTHVAPELSAPNLVDLATARWNDFVRGGMFISRGGDTENEVEWCANIAIDNDLAFLIIDTECHKTDMGGSREWTERLYAGLRGRLGAAFPLYNVTFGIHSSPEVVNHDALRKHNVVGVWEAYDELGRSYGVKRTADKMRAEGWKPPVIAIGDKALPNDAAEIRTMAPGSLGGLWLWAPEQAGSDVVLLNGLTFPDAPPPPPPPPPPARLTRAEALALVRDSEPYKRANGEIAKAWDYWRASNGGEHKLLTDFLAGRSGAPALKTKFGRGWVRLTEAD